MRALVLLCVLLLPVLARADEPTITVAVGKETRSFTRASFWPGPTLPPSRWCVTSLIAGR
jgi:hypothetical protein